MKYGEQQIGNCAVDSGQLILIDPCYVLKSKPDGEDGYSYKELLDKWEEIGWDKLHFETNYGIIVSSGYGDGIYPVYATIKNGIVQEVRIDFTQEEDY